MPSNSPPSDPILPYAHPASAARTSPIPIALTPEQLTALTVGQTLYRPIRRAVFYAKFDGWSVAVFAMLTTVCSLTSPPALILGIGMGVVAWVELREANRLAVGDERSPRRLAINQGALASLLIGYALWQLTHSADSTEMESIRSQLSGDPAAMKLVSTMSELIPRLVYGTLIIVAILMQGGTALYYLSRRKAIDAYLRGTPAWVRALPSP